MFGHETGNATIVTIATNNGLARPIGSAGFAATGGSSLAAARAPVEVQGGLVYPAGTIFGVLRDVTFSKDYVVVIDNETGKAIRVVELDFTVAGRGVAFGPDGKTLYAYKPPGDLHIVDTVTGALTLVGDVRDPSGTQLPGVSLQWDPDTGKFLALAGPRWNQLVRIDPYDASATYITTFEDMNVCTISRAPGPMAGPGGSVFPEGTWFAINNITNMLHAISMDTVAGVVYENRVVGALGPNASRVCGTAFALEETPWASPTIPGYPGYPGPTATEPTAADTATPTGTATGSATPPSGVPTPNASATSPPSAPQCICPIVQKRVPQVVIQDAIANPERYYAWRQRLNMGKPPGPDNPLRECLTLRNVNIDYHPLWNTPIWRVGCP